MAEKKKMPGGSGSQAPKTSNKGATIVKMGQEPGRKYGQNPNAGQKGGK